MQKIKICKVNVAGTSVGTYMGKVGLQPLKISDILVGMVKQGESKRHH